MPNSLSAVLIVKNEQHHLRACLEALQFADEIIVLDSGSSDDSLQIAQQLGAKVHQNENWQGFGIQRQRAQALASCQWILMIDADERVSAPLAQSIQQFIRDNPQGAIGSIARKSWFFGAFMQHSGWYPDYVMRLYPKNQAQYDSALVHEKLTNPQQLPVKTLAGDLLHYTYRDMNAYLSKSAHYAALWAQQRRGKRTSLASCIGHSAMCFVKMYVFKGGFLDGRQGLLLALLSAQSNFAKHASLLTQDNPHYKS